MRVLVVNRSDTASVNICDRLVEAGGWEPAGRFRQAAVLRRGPDALVEVQGPVVHDEDLDADLGPLRPDAVWFLSRHRAASGKPSLTVHPIGNHGDAEYGGEPRTLCPAAPADMGALLRRLRTHRDAAGLPHEVTYEATHHGPRMRVPSLFVEIGSDEAWYGDRASAEVLARAITDVLDAPSRGPPVAVGVGGGHYAPRQTEKALAGEYDFGHLLPSYAADPVAGPGLLRRCVEATPGCVGVYMHKKGLKGPQRQAVRSWCEEIGMGLL